MVKPAPQAIARIRPNPSAVIWWLTDSLGAIPIAAAIALAVDARMGARTGMLWASLLFMVGGFLRAMAVFRANTVGQSAAMAATARLREIGRAHV